MISRELALRTIALLEREASAIYDSHTVNGEWGFETLAHADYDELVACALELRRYVGE